MLSAVLRAAAFTAFVLSTRSRRRCAPPRRCSRPGAAAVRSLNFFAAPALVAYAADAGDVRRARCGSRNHALPLAVRSSGHSYSGASTRKGALIVDVSRIAHAEAAQSGGGPALRCGAGASTGAVLEAADAAGLVVVAGSSLSVSMAGFSLGGGFGMISRSLGLGADNVLEITAVLANGSLVVADKHHHRRLFDVMRAAGGGTFAVAVEFVIRAHPQLPVYRSLLYQHTPDFAPDFMRAVLHNASFWEPAGGAGPRPAKPGAPDCLSCTHLFLGGEQPGGTGLGLYAGASHAAADAALAPLLALAASHPDAFSLADHANHSNYLPFARYLSSLDPNELPARNFLTSIAVPAAHLGAALTRDAAAVVSSLAESALSVRTLGYECALGGAASLPRSGAAVPAGIRAAACLLVPLSSWASPALDAAEEAWVAAAAAALGAHGGAAYVNEFSSVAAVGEHPRRRLYGDRYG
ncbi:hypothetical protein DFJ74DRAFT_743974 [Hyaloraphidium curvatum]|nr:hypothetical protein DFJ74DRAFT_743974 [Hyaloraphidium curvatum]